MYMQLLVKVKFEPYYQRTPIWLHYKRTPDLESFEAR